MSPADSDRLVRWADMPLLLTVKETARILRVGRTTIYNKTLREHGFPLIRLGRNKYLVPRDELRQWVEGRVGPWSSRENA